ncbi:MAG: C4-dicarboxylate TRAP transporter substrate-binding protein [Proteobacteria bacterium]|nr:C4-dicarboxylate TRAP transporter substrate-binding protein [Pseudomonadota bacterium]
MHAIRRSAQLLLSIAAMLVLVTPAPAEAIRLTIVAGHPPVFLWVKHLKETFIPAVDQALAKTGTHRIVWNQAFGGTLAKVGGELDAIKEGLADIGYNPSLFNPSKLPMQNVSFIAPFNTDKPRLVTQVVEDLQKTIPEMGGAWERYNQIYLGGGIAIDSYHLWTTFEVRAIEDLKGRKICSPGAVVNWVKGTGAVGVAGDLTTYYNSIKTGVCDGVIIFATAAAPAKLVEVAPYITQVDFGTAYAGGITVNKDRWQRLPQEVRAALRAGVDAYAKAFYTAQDQSIQSSYDVMRAAGAKITKLSASERARWANLLPNVAKTWADVLEKDGLPGHRVLAGFMDGLRARGEHPPRNWDKE